ncbi:hypothetical protein Acr_29g0006600 [Actinidia rufa]|uniref:Reverse transcriptase domain-containing protein n=1 Tax=Actinidia rufa TaxID=165716 RepID=A0A7J0HEM0_9ERIC|nr:hypothetical protein Acr_29g0006600 [Actinidia rufa]
MASSTRGRGSQRGRGRGGRLYSPETNSYIDAEGFTMVKSKRGGSIGSSSHSVNQSKTTMADIVARDDMTDYIPKEIKSEHPNISEYDLMKKCMFFFKDQFSSNFCKDDSSMGSGSNKEEDTDECILVGESQDPDDDLEENIEDTEAIVNRAWSQRGLTAQVKFDLPGIMSDHSSCTISILGNNDRGATPFKFFNMWAKLDNFMELVRNSWAIEELLETQQLLHDNSADAQLQNKECDGGTKFFHGLIKSRRAKINIYLITLEGGVRSTSSSQVSDAFVHFYKGLLGTKGGCIELNRDMVARGRKLDPEQAQILTHLATEEEIRKALFSIGDDKAPGPDSYSFYFFKKVWNIVGRDFVAAIMEFFSSGHILRQINHSVLALIPKSKDSDRVDDYRPIACCNVIYKIISKIIASRLAPALTSIVDPAQETYVQNRKMIDNIYLLHELLRQYGRKMTSPRCMLNVDLRKAFDSVDWEFIRDDLVLLSRGDPTSIALIMEKIKHFGECSGLQTNMGKSSFFATGFCSDELETIKRITGFALGAFLFKYLGIPMAASRLTIAQFSPFMDKILDYIRAELIRSVLQGVECY